MQPPVSVKISECETSMSEKVKAARIAKIRDLFRETEDDAARQKRVRQEGRKSKTNATVGDREREEIGLWEFGHALRHENDKFVEDEIAGAAGFRPSMAWSATNGSAAAARRCH